MSNLIPKRPLLVSRLVNLAKPNPSPAVLHARQVCDQIQNSNTNTKSAIKLAQKVYQEIMLPQTPDGKPRFKASWKSVSALYEHVETRNVPYLRAKASNHSLWGSIQGLVAASLLSVQPFTLNQNSFNEFIGAGSGTLSAHSFIKARKNKRDEEMLTKIANEIERKLSGLDY